MHVQRLDHVTIRTHDLAATRDFYVGVIGLHEGARPPFGFPGLWLYDDASPIVHVIGLSAGEPRDEGSGTVDHVAFRVDGLASLRERVRRGEVSADERTVPRDGTVQMFLTDPNGVKIELNFAAAESAAPVLAEN